MADTEQTNLTSLTVDLLSAYFANNTVDSGELSGLIRSTHEALKGIDSPPAETPVEPEFKPAVSVRTSLASKDHIISLIDGKSYKTLKRHLSTHGLTPVEYRERYKLPRDYPMVAPSYSQTRRDVAARLGLGRKPRVTAPAPKATPVEAPAESPVETPVVEVAPPKSKKVAPKKSAAKTPSQVAAAPKRKASPKAAPVVAEATPPTVDAPPAPAESETVTPKKPGRKPKDALSAPTPTVAAKPATKPLSRKPKTPADPAAS